MKKILPLLLLVSSLAYAQDSLDLTFLETQRSEGNPFSVPISVNTEGEISLFGGDDNILFRPALQLGYKKTDIEYSHPVVSNRFNFYPIQNELGWIQVKRKRLEIGAGLNALIKSSTLVGLIPYKGSMQTIIRYKANQEDESLPFKMPRTLQEMIDWNQNDSGTFQTYGGITAYAGYSLGIVSLAKVSFGLQNQFIVNIKKISDEEITLKISEESLKRREMVIGPNTTQVTLGNFSGRRFSSEFRLNLNNLEHHHFFEEALKGNLVYVQEHLPHKLQKVTWEGSDRHLYYGIPVVIGKIKSAGHYDLNTNGIETELDFTGSRTRGFLTPHRLHRDFVYQTDEGMVVIWSSEMSKTSEKVFNNRFLSKGRIIGIKGFDRDLPDNVRFGSVVSQIGLHISREEIEKVDGINMDEVAIHLKDRCMKERLSCRKDKNIRKIITKLKNFLGQPWKVMRGELGKLLLKEPAVIYAVVKTMQYKKEVYFKFLSEKYQSLEGSSPIEI